MISEFVAVVVSLLMVWAFITLIGHGSWVLLRALIRSASPPAPGGDAPRTSRTPERDDVQAMHRVLNRLVDENLIDPPLRDELRSKADQLTDPASVVMEPFGRRGEADTVEAQLAGSPRPEVAPPTATSEFTPDRLTGHRTEGERPSGPPRGQHEAAATDNAPAAAWVEASESREEPTEPALSRSEIIHSFLAAHNIRWGELVAGLLIIVCSIGLVISLWNTLVQTHRVLPSLIFLGGNAAIFAAGLYTLSRWRLRHTSRAVLVIATLLVPLSILAGLAATESGSDSVLLNDPITWLALVAAGSIYGGLLWRAGVALVGRCSVRAFLLATAGPAAVLPFVPACLRLLGDQLGAAVGAGAIPLAAAFLVDARRTSRAGASMGPAASRNRLLILGVGTFGLACLIGYVAWLIDVDQLVTTLPVAIASLPAFVAAAASARQIALRARSDTHAMVGSVLVVLAILLSAAVLPAAMIDTRWLWWWGGVLTISGLAAAAMMKRPMWLSLSTAPLGIAATLTSPVWLGGSAWRDTPLWRLVVGGEPMLAVLMIAAALAGLSRLCRRDKSRRWMERAAGAWFASGLLLAAALSVAPPGWLGIAPAWSVTMVLLSGAGLAAAGSLRLPHLWIASAVLTSLVGISIVRPMTLAVPPTWQPPSHWMLLLLGISVALLIQTAVAARLIRSRSVDRRSLRVSIHHWNETSVWLACAASVVAAVFVARDWSESAWGTGGAAVLCLIASLRPRCVARVRVAQLLSLFAAAAVGYGMFSGWLFARSAWVGGWAPWGWALLLAATAGISFAVREVARAGGDHWAPRRRALSFLNRRCAAPRHLIDGPATAAATGLVLVGAAFSFVTVLARAAGEEAFGSHWHSRWMTPLAALAAVTGTVVWYRRHETQRRIADFLSVLLFVSGIIWCSVRAAAGFATDPTGELVVATSLILAACCAGWWLTAVTRRAPAAVLDSVCAAALVCVLASASGVLLITGWIDPLMDGAPVQTRPTWVTAAWWLVAAAALLVAATTKRSATLANVSAGLACAAVALVVPWFGADHPVVWLQTASLAALAWAGVARWWARAELRDVVGAAIGGCHRFAAVIGIGSAAAAIVVILFNMPQLSPVLGPAGAAASAVTLGLGVAGRLRTSSGPTVVSGLLSAPVASSLFAGHLAWLAVAVDLATAGQMPLVLATVWCAAGAASVVRYHLRSSAGDFWHAAGASTSSMMLALAVGTRASALIPWIGCASAVATGVLVARVGGDRWPGRARVTVSRLLGWFVLIAGAFFAVAFLAPERDAAVWTAVIGWLAAWTVVWRCLAPDGDAHTVTARGAIPDPEASWFLWIAVLGELAVTVDAGAALGRNAHPLDPLAWLRVLVLAAVSASAVTRASRRLIWQPALGIVLVLASVMVVRIGILFGAAQPARMTAASISAGFVLALLTYQLPAVHRIAVRLGRRIGSSSKLALGRLAGAVWQVALLLVAVTVAVVVGMIAAAADPPAIRLAVVTVALAAWAIAEVSELTRSPALKHMAVTVGLVAMGLWASVPGGGPVDPWLAGSMRWLVLSVLTIPMVWLVLPRLLGERIAERWQPALRQGAVMAASAAAGSLTVMLTMEMTLRSRDGIPEVAPSLVIGAAVTLALLSLWAALASILSGPGWRRYSLNLPDRGRQILIVAAQAIGVLTWLHVFLCRPDWSLVDLRDYWPYLVMALAFLSAGATEWARRRDDLILAKTLRQTALYLPLVPVIGFWLTAAPAAAGWWFSGQQVPYALLLATGAAYYLAVSALWPGMMPRIGAAVLGNAALWVVLVQTPGWSFLRHPQAWLIPPATCVLVVAHVYRHRLPPPVASGIRYAGALVIYISSTADVLIADIGSNLMEPVILIMLALIGMASGVALRVRPFLYVGAMFVFVAVTSMVWHAQRAIDQSWPWWVFGITTGIGLLAGLMAIEKHKSQLQRLADSLRSWEP